MQSASMICADRQRALAILAKAEVDRSAGDLETTRSHYLHALEVFISLADAVPDSVDALRDIAICLDRVGEFELSISEFQKAIEYHLDQLTILRRILELTNDEPLFILDLSTSLGRLGDVERACKSFPLAREYYEQSNTVLLNLPASDQIEPYFSLSVGVSWFRLGQLAEDLQDLAVAYSAYQNQLAATRKAMLSCEESFETLRQLSTCLQHLGDVARRLGKIHVAADFLESMLETDKRLCDKFGKTPELLENLVASYELVGELETSRGHYVSAEKLYRAQLQVARELILSVGSTPKALATTCAVLCHLGDTTLNLGKYKEAISLHSEQLSISRQLLALSEDPVESLRALSSSLERLGTAHQMLGDMSSAYASFEEMLSVVQDVLSRDEHDPTALRSLGICLRLLGDIERSWGQFNIAHSRYRRQLSLACRVIELTDENAISLSDWIIALCRLGDVERIFENFALAQELFEKQLEVAQRLLNLAGETPAALLCLGTSLERIGSLEVLCNRLPEAALHFEGLVQTAQRFAVATSDAPDGLRLLGIAFERLADVAKKQGDLDSALERYQRQFENLLKIATAFGETPQTLRDLSVCRRSLGDIEDARGNWGAAAAHWVQSAEYVTGIDSQLATWPVDAAMCASRLVGAASAGVLPITGAFALQRRLSTGLSNFCDLNDPEPLEHAASEIAKFYAAWLRLAVEREPARIPELLGAMQGRKLTALVLSELEDADGSQAASDPTLLRYLKLRVELRRMAVGLQLLDFSGFGQAEPGIGNRTSESIESSKEAGFRHVADYRERLREFESVRMALAASQPQLAALSPQCPNFCTSALQAALALGEGLLLLFDHETLGSNQSTAHGLLVGPQTVRLIPLPALGDLARKALKIYESVSSPRTAVRDCRQIGQAISEHAAGGAEGLDAAIREALWSPVVQGLHGADADLQSARHLHVVIHGDLHALPLANAAPLLVSVYPGLVFYWQQRLAEAAPHANAVSVRVFSPSPGELKPLAPIPFVNAEALLVATHWPNSHHTPQSAEIRDAVLHVACHGELPPGSHDARLILGPAERMGVNDVLRGAPTACVVYLSACSLGQTREDEFGDPLGLVSAFLLRGSRTVVAALAPIDDFFAPMLAHLFHRELRRQAERGIPLDGSLALQVAKSQLQTGRWHPAEISGRLALEYEAELLASLRSAYRPVISDAIKSATATGHRIQQEAALHQLIGGWMGSRMAETPRLKSSIEIAELVDDVCMTLTRDLSGAADLVLDELLRSRNSFSRLSQVQGLLLSIQAFGRSL